MDMRYDRTDTYDKSHATVDTTKDFLSLISQYAYKGFDLRYFGTYVDTKDKLHGVETQDVTQNVTGTYSNTFFNGRLLFGTSYNIISDDVTTVGDGRGRDRQCPGVSLPAAFLLSATRPTWAPSTRTPPSSTAT